MPFTVEDFHDLLRLLEAHPEWRAELRRHVLDAELLELPALVRQLVEAQARTEQRLTELAEAQARTEEQIAALAVRVGGLAGDIAELKTGVGDLKGQALEQRYRERAPAYFDGLAWRLRVVERARLADLLEAAVRAGGLTRGERGEVLDTDVVLTGRRRTDEADVYLLVEVSATIDPHDVERAADRAALLARLGRPAIPVVAGQKIAPGAEALARERGVLQVRDGRDTPPGAP